MGIKYLNHYLKKHCTKKSFQQIHLSEFSGKRITVDISIYLYKFLGESAKVIMNHTNKTDETNHAIVNCDMNIYMENLYLFLALFYHYKITPIIVFDGKPPPEKRELLKKRYVEKKNAESRYDQLQLENENEESSNEMHNLCKKLVRIKTEHLEKAKELVVAFGFPYIQAEGEADLICVNYVQQGIAWACMSDDMDMVLLGCPRVLRNMNLFSHCATMYHSESVLDELGMTREKLVETLVVNGLTDYYHITEESGMNDASRLYDVLDAVRVGQDARIIEDVTMEIQTQTLTNVCVRDDEIRNICDLFMNKNHIEFKDYACNVLEPVMNLCEIQNIMTNYGFIFSDSICSI